MPNLTPSIELVLDKPRYLRLDAEAIFTAERELCRLWGRQINIITIFASIETLTLNDIAVLLWQALRDDDPTLTLAQTRQLLIAFDKLGAILEALFAAWNAATQSAAPREETNGSDGPFVSPGTFSGATPVLS